MIQKLRLGKIPVMVMLVGLGTLAGGPSGAVADDRSVHEDPWRLLARGQFAGVEEATRDRTDALAVWCRSAAEVESGGMVQSAGGAGSGGEIASAAALFVDGSFGEVAESLTELLTPDDEGLPPESRLHLQLMLGACQVELGLIEDAEANLTAALAQARLVRLPVSECFALLTRGRARVRLRQTEPPREDLTAALTLSRQEELPRWSGTAAIALSVISRLQMDLDTALHWRQEALAYYQAADDTWGQARSLHYIATIGIMRGQLTRAMAQLQQALVLARDADDDGVLGGVLGEMASINYLLGDFEQALIQYREAVRLAPNPWRRGMMLINIGSILEYQGHYAEALPVLEEALELMRQVGDHRTEAVALQSLGETLCEIRRFDEGLAILDEAVAVAREYEIPLSEAYALKAKGHGLLDKGDLEGAAIALAEATAISRRIDYFDILEWSLLGQAQVARREGRPADAMAHLEEALAEVAAVRRRSGGASSVTSGIVGQAAGIYAELIDLLYELHRQEPDRGLDRRAFAVAQEAKARALLDLLTEAEFDLRFSAVGGYRQQEAEILERIIATEKGLEEAQTAAADSVGRLRAELAAAEDELALLEADLRTRDPRYAEVLYPEPLSLRALTEEVLRPGEVFLEFSLGDSASYLWAVDALGVEFVALPPRAVIEQQVRELLPLLQDYNLTGGEPAWLSPPAYRLYTTLLGKVSAKVAHAERMVVSPDGILHYLPFGALITDDATATSLGDLSWLVRRTVISTTPSASVLAAVRRREDPADDQRRSWLLVGDPVLVSDSEAGVLARAAGAAGLPPLPYASRELEALYMRAPDGSAVLLRGSAATLTGLDAAVAGQSFSVIHLATHGLFNEARPRYSGLVLSPDPDTGDDGFLSVSEVFGLDLVCDQVVLSACGSALGQQVTGEGLVGLTRSFLFAGARNIVATLWDVSGEATAALMTSYYDQLAAGNVDRATALTDAQRIALTGGTSPAPAGVDWSHPAFWAAFVLGGDGR